MPSESPDLKVNRGDVGSLTNQCDSGDYIPIKNKKNTRRIIDNSDSDSDCQDERRSNGSNLQSVYRGDKNSTCTEKALSSANASDDESTQKNCLESDTDESSNIFRRNSNSSDTGKSPLKIRSFSRSDSASNSPTHGSISPGKCKSGKITKSETQDKLGNDSESEEDILVLRKKKKVHSNENDNQSGRNSSASNHSVSSHSNYSVAKAFNCMESKPQESESDEDLTIFKRKSSVLQSRPAYEGSDGSDSDKRSPKKSDPSQMSRTQSKKNNLNKRFKDLMSSRRDKTDKSGPILNDIHSSSSSGSDIDDTSIEKIKKKIKDRTEHLKSTIYDPDTSDDEEAHRIDAGREKVKTNKQKHSDSPKPVRMSAKQAMESMVKIKSESNRMLREKDVSLPYHRPKALKLKDIMRRHRPALTEDGKAMPIKMNTEQLQKYAKMLEDRQKEMMELCKSDTEDENELESNKTEDSQKKNPNEKESPYNANAENPSQSKETHEEAVSTMSENNDGLFDETIASELNVITLAKDLETAPGLPEMNIVTEEENELKADPTEDSKQSATLPIEQNSIEEVDQIAENILPTTAENSRSLENGSNDAIEKPNTEVDSQLISLHYDSEKIDESKPEILSRKLDNAEDVPKDSLEHDKRDCTKDHEDRLNDGINKKVEAIEGFSDTEMEVEDFDKIIENAELLESNVNKEAIDSPMLIRDPVPRISNPKLTGAPGMVIDLDPVMPKKLSGIQLLKERFTYFSKLKTPEEIERQTKSKIKPGTQHLKLKQELEDKIAEQRSLEWAKRLDEEKQNELKMKERTSDSEDEDNLEKLEAQLEETESNKLSDSEQEEEELVENDVAMDDKPRKENPFADEEAEESDCDETNEVGEQNNDEAAEASDEDESSEESSDADDELEKSIPRKGRILKAFEDSDEEDSKSTETDAATNVHTTKELIKADAKSKNTEHVNLIPNDIVVNDSISSEKSCNTQDDDIQSAQLQKSISEDMFSQESKEKSQKIEATFKTPEWITDQNAAKEDGKLPVICNTQPFDEDKFNDIAFMCSGTFSQNYSTQPLTATMSSDPKSQEIGDGGLEICTSKFADSELVRGVNDTATNITEIAEEAKEIESSHKEEKTGDDKVSSSKETLSKEDGTILKSILDELDGPDFETPTNKFFTGASDKENKQIIANSQMKRRFIIDSDDEDSEQNKVKRKKLKKKKLEDRALQISDDEEEPTAAVEASETEDEYESAIEDDADREVEYDSEENEVQVSKPHKKRVKGTEFFEREAELTSEDEWAGSGDEDEAGLDRMEREEGDDDRFHQGQLQRELGQIHMRDVLDQDKREVRMIQELLFEDGDLGDGHRQRKFRWKDLYGDDEGGGSSLELGGAAEEDESEELWRKQRHEREAYLQQLKKQQGEEEVTSNVTFNRTALIKANLSTISKTDTSLLLEVQSAKELMESPAPEKKNAKDVPSPVKKPFSIMQTRGGFLSRAGALSRLAALAPASSGDHTAAAPTHKGNFVFATVSPDTHAAKVSKRKAEAHVVGTPNLIKKMKTEEKKTIHSRLSLLDQMKT